MKKKLECLSAENITNRFLNSGNALAQHYLEAAIRDNPWMEIMRRSRIADIMEEYKCSEKKALQIYKKELAEWKKEYNTPLAVANRRIAELEARIETIKEFINDPNYLDRYD